MKKVYHFCMNMVYTEYMADKSSRYLLNLENALKVKLEKEAKKNRRSLSAEIQHRLELSLKGEA